MNDFNETSTPNDENHAYNQQNQGSGPETYNYSSQQNPQYSPQHEGGKGLAIASMVLGIIGLLTVCILIGGPISIVGLVLGIVALVKSGAGKGFAITGIVTSSIAILFFLLSIVGIIAMNDITYTTPSNTYKVEYSVPLYEK